MRLILFLHRWLGIMLCGLFLMWFVSGMVLMYHPFPSLPETERHAHSQNIDPSRISIAPIEAIRFSGIMAPDRLRLIDLGGQPIYVVHSGKETPMLIGADTGESIAPIHQETAGRIATEFVGIPPSAIEGSMEYDQWIVHQRFDAYRPFFRIHFPDPEATVLYVSASTGEVLQKTRSAERAWNYVGAVVHWIYPTNLRQYSEIWNQVVWAISFLGVLTAFGGVWLGVVRVWQGIQRKRLNGLSPFTGWLRGHHLLGLVSGVIICTWILSGWLSVDQGRLFSMPTPTLQQVQDFRGSSFGQGVQFITAPAFGTFGDHKEVEFIVVGGKLLLLGKGTESQLYASRGARGFVPSRLTKRELVSAVRRAWPGLNVRLVEEVQPDDRYGHLRESHLPKQTLRVILDDPAQTWVHIDMQTGMIVSVMDKSRRMYRWLFNGLHSLDFPGLVDHRPLWDVLMLSLLMLGAIFSMTSVVLGWRRMLRYCRGV
ncbi:MAG TPA: PepSY domain-containing protein [Nitrospirales bacterium]|nr:PepSY domain-containing protein [Nitrospirales bacterium]